MRFTIVFGLLGAALAALAVQQVRGAVGLDWLVVGLESDLALCLLVLAALYGFRSTGVEVEALSRRPGWSPVIRAILLPYLLLARAVLWVASRFDREGLLNPLAPGLFIGRWPFRSERSRLSAVGIDAVLNLCWEFPGPSRMDRGPERGSVPILDGAAPTDRQFEEAVRWAARRRDEGRSILIHCAQGHGRTATIAAAVLVRLGLAVDAERALAMIRAARPGARPSRGQWAALERYLSRPSGGLDDRGQGPDLLDSTAQ